MTNEKLLECLYQIQSLLESLGYTPIRIDPLVEDPLNQNQKHLSAPSISVVNNGHVKQQIVMNGIVLEGKIRKSLKEESLNHALWLVTEAQTFVETKPDKAHRWLGFAQATLWFCGLSSISDLKDTNR